MTRTDVNRLNKDLAKISGGKTTLSDFIDAAMALDPALAPALEGIYCGTDGKVHEQIPGTRYFIAFGWYADPKSSNPPKVEYAYIS